MAQPVPPPASQAHPALRALVGRGTYLGVGVVDVDAERAKALKLKEARGAEVTMVNEETPAAKAGIKVGDVILEYNGQPVAGTKELQRLVRETPAGRQVKIELWRNGAPATVNATVEESKGVYTFDWPFGGINLPPMPPIDIPRMVTAMQIPALGVECESLASDSQLAEFFGVKDGLLVRSVSRNSAAEKAGIKAGDVIVKIGDTHIGNHRDLAAALRANRTKGAFPATVMRNKREMALTVTLEDSGWPEHF
jgi:serine protease Do